jgi:TonB-linked SusC/RagA family outer membrane protein
MKRIILFLLIIFCYLSLGSAQVNVTGKVTDNQNNPLPGVSIRLGHTQSATMTDVNGIYTISATPADTLLFFMVGMVTQRIAVGGRTSIDVTLETEVTNLNEIVVIGYGTVKKSDLTGSVSSIKGEEISKITSLNAEQGLQGKVPGVMVSSTSGAPGAIPIVRIRGVGTFNNASPIFVVDGVILDDISFLSSGDIASMDVLKDASATAIYGARGANGVIIVTTKTGKAGQEKATFNYNAEYGSQNLAKKIKLLTGRQFATVANQINPGSYNNVDLVPNTDWQDLIFHSASVQNHQLSVTGSTKTTQYYVGLSYFNQDGIVDKSHYSRITLKLNNTYNLGKFFKLGNNITIAPYKQENAPNVVATVYKAQPLISPYYPDGSFAAVPNVGNPLATLAYTNDNFKGIREVGNIFAEVNFLKSFTFRSSFGTDASYNTSVNFTPAYTVYNSDGSISQQQNLQNTLTKTSADNLTWLWENTLSFKRAFGKHAFDAVAGYTSQETNSNNMGLQGKNIIRDGQDFWYLNNSTYISNALQYYNAPVNGLSPNDIDPNLYYSMVSYLFRVNYTFNDKYIFTATYRRDGSSKFSESNRFGDFPSFAAGWNISRENFMHNFPLISNLKIRGSWGIIGNEKIRYDKRYSLTQDMLAVFGANATGNTATSYAVSGNPDLKWENTTQTDLGLELGLLNNRLTSEFDYYRRVTKDILIPLAVPFYLGNGNGAQVWYNAASVLNSGFEFKVDWKDKIGKVDYGFGILGTTVHNEVLKIGGSSGVDSVLYGGFMAGAPVTQSRVGLPIGAFYGYKTNGVFQSQDELNAYPHLPDAVPGDLRIVDVNNDKVINSADRTYIGSSIPKFIFGFNGFAQYHGFDFSFYFQGQTGNKIFNAKEMIRPDPYNFEEHVIHAWTGPGTSNTEPRATFGGNNYLPSDRFVQDASFLRLRDVTLGYTIPLSVTSKIKMKQLRFYVKAINLFTITKYTGYTPEISTGEIFSNKSSITVNKSGDVLANGIDNSVYPVTRIYSFGVNLTF